MRRFLVLAIPVALMLTASVPAQAAAIQIGSLAGLSQNDFYDWGANVPDAVDKPSGTVVTSNGLATATLEDGAPGFSGYIEGTDFLGIFAVGDNVLFTGNYANTAISEAFEILFTAPIAGLGTQIQSNNNGLFTATLEVFNGAVSLGVFGVGGDNDSSEANTAPFLGARSDALDITRAIFTLTSNNGVGFAINRLYTTDSPNPAVDPTIPEPATMTLVGAGALAAAYRRRRQSKKQ